jgi:hypothetical protein
LHLAAYASLQDWDAIYIYSYHHGHDDWNHQRINGFFDVDGNPIVMSLLPQMAGMFREGLLRPASREIRLRFSRSDMLLEAAAPRGALFFSGLNDATPLSYRVRIQDFDAPRTPDWREYQVAPLQSPYQSDTREISWDPPREVLTVDAPSAQGCTGIIPAVPLVFGDMTLSGSGAFATVAWTSDRDIPLAQSRSSLLTIVGRAENSGMIWDGSSTVHNNWGTTPALMQPCIIRVVFTGCDTVRIYPLDSLGRASTYRAFAKDGIGEIPVTIDPAVFRTPWYGVERISASPSAVDESRVPSAFRVRVYPNPADDALIVQFALPSASSARVSLHDMLGRRVAELDGGLAAPGEKRFRIPTGHLVEGVYLLRAESGGGNAKIMITVAHR